MNRKHIQKRYIVHRRTRAKPDGVILRTPHPVVLAQSFTFGQTVN